MGEWAYVADGEVPGAHELMRVLSKSAPKDQEAASDIPGWAATPSKPKTGGEGALGCGQSPWSGKAERFEMVANSPTQVPEEI